uniref:tRNA threonylcarbamoyladenosine dehydratase isoform X4 n=1 Tax=Elaeis guineensis var. tenera TaxID=51953 RepID=A0A8N4ETF9_ELAGV|nr:tRNA threonylcarbamoyladenosine dehydratase isoform X4 [Elaeis guineensis]
MAERSKQWLLVGTGALLGSLSTVALINLLSRWAGKRQVKRLLTGCSVIADRSGGLSVWSHQKKTRNEIFLTRDSPGKLGKEKLFGSCGTRYNGAPDGLVYSNLLKDEVVSEQLTRNIQFFGMESQQKVTESYVVVIGLGGVGSHAASMLLRSGVGRLLLVDFDQVSLSSLNRHAVAMRDDVGIPKALCLQKHFSAIFPECRIEARVQLYDASSEEEILSGQPDFVLDCIDNIDTKVRHRLRKDYGIEGGIPVVFSLEKPKVKLLPFKGLTGQEENPSDYQIVPGFRVRIIPVLGTIPAIFGQVMASYVVTQLAGLCVQTEPVVNLDLDHYRILHQRLLEHEELTYGSAIQVLVDVEEVMYVVKELWHGRSARDHSKKDVGRKMWRSVNELMLVSKHVSLLEDIKSCGQKYTIEWLLKKLLKLLYHALEGSCHKISYRWDKSRPATVNNLIPLKFTEAEAHESTTVDRIKEEEPEFYTMVTSVLKRAEEEFAL